jgi:hypothetical protein
MECSDIYAFIGACTIKERLDNKGVYFIEVEETDKQDQV